MRHDSSGQYVPSACSTPGKIKCSVRGKDIDLIIDEVAQAYEGAIPADCYHQPNMPVDELEGEMKLMPLVDSWAYRVILTKDCAESTDDLQF